MPLAVYHLLHCMHWWFLGWQGLVVDIVTSVWQSSTCLNLGPNHCQPCLTPPKMPCPTFSRFTCNFNQITQEIECLCHEHDKAIQATNNLRRNNKRLKKALHQHKIINFENSRVPKVQLFFADVINGDSTYYA